MKIDGVDKHYAYLAPDEPIEIGDMVDVPFGKANVERTGQVVSIETYAYSEAPYPPEKMKIIIGLSNNET